MIWVDILKPTMQMSKSRIPESRSPSGTLGPAGIDADSGRLNMNATVFVGGASASAEVGGRKKESGCIHCSSGISQGSPAPAAGSSKVCQGFADLISGKIYFELSSEKLEQRRGPRNPVTPKYPSTTLLYKYQNISHLMDIWYDRAQLVRLVPW